MKLLAKIFRWSSAVPRQRFPQSQLLPDARAGGEGNNATRNNTRRELLRIVLRDTLNRQGIPAAWLSADAVVSTSRSGVQGIHWRLVVRHWNPRLLTHAPALQQQLIKRVMTFDPLAANWLTGISWQFALPDESVCPSMPHPGIWTATPKEDASEANAGSAEPTVEVIAGPVRISDPGRSIQDAEAEARADLERLLAVREADHQRHSGGDTTKALQSQFKRTEPMRLE